MKFMAALALLALTLCGCGEKQLVVSDLPATSDSSLAALPADTTKVEVGDVEATVDVELTLVPGSTQGVAVEELRNAKQKLNSLTVSLSGSQPAELWIRALLKTNENFPTRPVALRGKVFREITKGSPEEVFTFQTVLDGFSSSNRRVADGKYFPMEFLADIRKELPTLPSTMLVYAEVEVIMSPTGTDPTTIDPATYTSGPEDVGILLSNPVRINYDPIQAPAPEAPAPSLESLLQNPLTLPAAPEAAAPAQPAQPEPAVEAPAIETPSAGAPANTAAATEAIGAAQ